MYQEKKSYLALVCKLSATSGMASRLVTSTFWHTTFDDIFKDFIPDEWTLEPTDQGMPKEWKQCKDSAKVKFICEDCERSWTSMNGRVIFWYKKIDKKDDKKELKAEERKCTSDEGKNDEPKKTDKYSLRFRLYGQQCNVCTDGTPDGKFTNPMWYEDETRRILKNVHKKIKKAIYNIQPEDLNDRKRPGRMRMSHDSRRCQACYEGQCSSK